MSAHRIMFGGGRVGGKTMEQLRSLAAKARAAHAAGRLKERNRACAEHDRLWLKTYASNPEAAIP